MDEVFSDKLNERQLQVVLHTMGCIGSNPDNIMYLKTEEYPTDLWPIDLIIFKPTEYFDYYIMQTVGLSSYYFNKESGRKELLIVLPKNWKPIFDKDEYNWPRELLRDLAYGAVDNKTGVQYGQVFINEKVYEGSKNIIGGIVTVAEELPIELYEAEIMNSYTNILQLVPISKEDLSKIEEIGPIKFIQYDLHDSEGPKMIPEIIEKKLEGIDKIIKENEDNLKKSR